MDRFETVVFKGRIAICLSIKELCVYWYFYRRRVISIGNSQTIYIETEFKFALIASVQLKLNEVVNKFRFACHNLK